MSANKGLSGLTLPHLDDRLVEKLLEAAHSEKDELFTLTLTTQSGLPILLVINRAYARSFAYGRSEKGDEDVDMDDDVPNQKMHIFCAMTPGDQFISLYKANNIIPGYVALDDGDRTIFMAVDQLTHGLMTASIRHHYQFLFFNGNEQFGEGIVALKLHPMKIDADAKVYEVSNSAEDVLNMKKRLETLTSALTVGYRTELQNPSAQSNGSADVEKGESAIIDEVADEE